MIVDENISVMLLGEKYFKTFTLKGVCDTTKSTAVLVCWLAASRAQADEIVSPAIATSELGPRLKILR
jgi:uncharacterized protein